MLYWDQEIGDGDRDSNSVNDYAVACRTVTAAMTLSNGNDK
jgi:hypothetical protein